MISLLESRGIAHEVGIAALDKDTGRVMLVQVGRSSAHQEPSSLQHLNWVMLWDLLFEASRLRNVRQDATSDVHSLSIARSRP